MSVARVRSRLAHVVMIGVEKGRRCFVAFENDMSR